MKVKLRSRAWGTAAAMVALALSGCAVNEAGALDSSTGMSGELIGVGASSQGAAQEAWIAGFQKSHPRATVNYEPAGSGAGREAFQQGAAAFAGSDQPFSTEEIADGPFRMCSPDSALVQLPAYISPIALIFNLEGVTSLNLDASTVAAIFAGQVDRWDDPQVAFQNPGVALPSVPITAVHRSDKSGTTGNFTEYLAAAAPTVWSIDATETWPTKFGGEGAQGTSGVVEAVRSGVGTIGYADASRSGGLGVAKLLVGNRYVSPTPQAAAAIVDVSGSGSGREPTDLAIELDRAGDVEGAYPLVLVSYLVACETYRDGDKAALTKEYLRWVVSEAGQEAAAESAGSAPISAKLRGRAEGAIEQIGSGQ